MIVAAGLLVRCYGSVATRRGTHNRGIFAASNQNINNVRRDSFPRFRAKGTKHQPKGIGIVCAVPALSPTLLAGGVVRGIPQGWVSPQYYFE